MESPVAGMEWYLGEGVGVSGGLNPCCIVELKYLGKKSTPDNQLQFRVCYSLVIVRAFHLLLASLAPTTVSLAPTPQMPSARAKN